MRAIKTLWLLAMWLYSLLIGLADMAVGISKHFFHRIKTTWSSNEQ